MSRGGIFPKLFQSQVLGWVEHDGAFLDDPTIAMRLHISLEEARSLLASMADQGLITIKGFGKDRALFVGLVKRATATTARPVSRTIKKADADSEPKLSRIDMIRNINERLKRQKVDGPTSPAPASHPPICLVTSTPPPAAKPPTLPHVRRQPPPPAKPVETQEPRPPLLDLGMTVEFNLPTKAMADLIEAAAKTGVQPHDVARALVIKALRPDKKCVRIRAAVASLAVRQGRSIESVVSEFIEVGLRAHSAQPIGGEPVV